MRTNTRKPPHTPIPHRHLRKQKEPSILSCGKCSGHVTPNNAVWSQILGLLINTVIHLELVTQLWALRNGQSFPASAEPKVLLALWKLSQTLRAGWGQALGGRECEEGTEARSHHTVGSHWASPKWKREMNGAQIWTNVLSLYIGHVV